MIENIQLTALLFLIIAQLIISGNKAEDVAYAVKIQIMLIWVISIITIIVTTLIRIWSI